MTDFTIIDAHCHIFPDKVAKKAVANIGGFYSLPMHLDGTAATLLKNRDLGISHFVVCSVATKPEQVDSINNFILQTVKAYPQYLSGLITLHPDMSGAQIEKSINFALLNGLKGIKLHSDFQEFDIDSAAAEKIYQRAEGVLPILFHIGDERLNFSRPFKLASILKKYKNLTAIAAHFGGYTKWDEVDCFLDTPNVYFDTSSSLFKLSKDTAISLIEKFGNQRFMFGTDYPMWQVAEELVRLYKLNLSDKQLENILYNNAKRIYNINEKE